MLGLRTRLGAATGSTIGAALPALVFVLLASSAMASASSCQQENDTGPNGLIKNGTDSSIASLSTMYRKWSRSANELAGNYCAIAWRYTASRYYEHGQVCVGAHS
jgi:hypothetical protein